MRLATLHHRGRDRLAALLDDETVLDLAAAGKGPFASMLALIEAGDPGLAAAGAALAAAPVEARFSVAEARWRVPLTPVQFHDCLVVEEHLRTSFAAAERMTGRSFAIPEVWYEQPVCYRGNRLSFVGHEEDVVWPAYAEFLELALAAVIGRRGRDLAPEEAPDRIFGYAILNDVSARDGQMREMPGQLGPAKGKDFDTGNVPGPIILTANEVEHPAALAMEARVNGERWGGATRPTCTTISARSWPTSRPSRRSPRRGHRRGHRGHGLRARDRPPPRAGRPHGADDRGHRHAREHDTEARVTGHGTVPARPRWSARTAASGPAPTSSASPPGRRAASCGGASGWAGTRGRSTDAAPSPRHPQGPGPLGVRRPKSGPPCCARRLAAPRPAIGWAPDRGEDGGLPRGAQPRPPAAANP